MTHMTKRLRTRPRTTTSRCLVTGALLGVAALAAASASAASPGTWRQLPESARSPQGTQASPLRLADGSLDVAYAAQNADGTNTDLLTALIAANGAVTAGPAIASGWNGISGPSLILQPGGIAAFFGGLHSTDSNDPNQDLNVAGAPAAGGPWAVAPGTASATDGINDDQAYASDVSAVALPDGTPLEAWAHTLGVTVHRGIGPATPNQDFQAAFGGCCGYDVTLAADGASGQPAVTWYTGAAGHAGYYEQAIDAATGAPAGAPALVPGSAIAGQSAEPRARAALTGRPGRPGLFTALAGGYPVQNRVVVWRVGSSKSTVISTGRGSLRNVNVAADAAGRLWVAWTRETDTGTQLFASRSNPAVTTFETPVSVKLPAGASDSFALAASAQPKTLDVVGTFGPGPGAAAVAISSTQLAPGEDVQVAPLRVRAGNLAVAVVHVTDAGVALAGARVTRVTGGAARAAAGHTSAGARTNAAGVARLRLGSFRHSTTVRLRVTKAGFATRTLTVRVRVR
jgi:hypothetical protein